MAPTVDEATSAEPPAPLPTIVRLPQPSQPSPPSDRSDRTWIAVLATTAVVGGLAIATYALVLKDPPAPAPAPAPSQVPVQAPVAPVDAAIAAVETPPKPPTTPTPPQQPASSLVTAELASVEHPVIETIVAPTAGQVAIATNVPAVKAGDTVVTLKGKPPASPRIAQLESKIRELEELAKTDPAAHADELAKARADLAAQQQPAMTWVKATASGVLQLQVALNDEIKRGDTLAVVRDDRIWIGVARFPTEQPTAMWSCAVSSPDNTRTAACRIQATEVVDGATRVTVEISTTSATTWLRDADRPRLMLAPTTGR